VLGKNCTILTNSLDKHKDTVPLAGIIEAMHVGKKKLSSLYMQKYAINEFCSSRSQLIMALMNLRNHVITEDRLIKLNNFVENNIYKVGS
jgi:hypothetical protein